jgi:hypothetical protein
LKKWRLPGGGSVEGRGKGSSCLLALLILEGLDNGLPSSEASNPPLIQQRPITRLVVLQQVWGTNCNPWLEEVSSVAHNTSRTPPLSNHLYIQRLAQGSPSAVARQNRNA